MVQSDSRLSWEATEEVGRVNGKEEGETNTNNESSSLKDDCRGRLNLRVLLKSSQRQFVIRLYDVYCRRNRRNDNCNIKTVVVSVNGTLNRKMDNHK